MIVRSHALPSLPTYTVFSPFQHHINEENKGVYIYAGDIHND